MFNKWTVRLVCVTGVYKRKICPPRCIYYTHDACMYTIRVVILALNPRKSGQIANKGFMIHYGRYRAQLAILKSPKQNPCSNLLN